MRATFAAVLSLVGGVHGVLRTGVDFRSPCAATPDAVWNLTQRHGDGSAAITLASRPQCVGYPNMVAGAGEAPLGTAECDGAPTRLWQAPAAMGHLHNVGTDTCMEVDGQAACSRTVGVPASPLTANAGLPGTASASSESPGQGAWRAFDGAVSATSASASWKTAGGYGVDGWPTTNVTTNVTGQLVAGHWVQVVVPTPTVIAAYALLADGDHMPGRRGRPRGHVLCGAPTAGGPWTTIGLVADTGVSLSATQPSFATASMQAFSAFRLIVTRVHRMGTGAAQLGELRLTSDPQAFAAAVPEAPPSPVVGWTTASVDPWGAPALAAEVLHGGVDVDAVLSMPTPAARYIAALAARDGMDASLATRALWATNAGTTPDGGNASTVMSTSFVASSDFTESVYIQSPAAAGVWMYDISAGTVWESLSNDTTPFVFTTGHAYQVPAYTYMYL